MDNTEKNLIGKRIRLVKMDDPHPIEPGAEGTVLAIDDAGHIMVKWDNGRSLSLIPNVDTFNILN